jgi:hypothetical protein
MLKLISVGAACGISLNQPAMLFNAQTQNINRCKVFWKKKSKGTLP